MNIPALEMQEFIEEYGRLAFPEHRVLRADYFFHENGHSWLSVFLTEQNEKQLLCNAAGQVLCRYDRIMPLFVASSVKVSEDVAYLLEQLSGLRSRVPMERYENARAGLLTLTHPADPFAPAYLVLQDGLLGVVDPQGAVIVPAQYAQIRPMALNHPGDAAMFLCRRNVHSLNAVDVYDINGNCIFRQISNLLPREETLLTPPDTGAPLRKVKSLWVIRQSVDHPFPEDPDFQLVQENARRYTRRELQQSPSDSLQLAAMDEQPVWSCLPPEATPPQEVLFPLAAAIGASIGCATETVLQRLADYRSFRLEQMPLRDRLTHVTADTALDQLGFSVRAYHCLARRRLQTVADLLSMTSDDIAQLHHSTDSILAEINLFHHTLTELLQ